MTTGQYLLEQLQQRAAQAYSGVIDANDGDRYFKWGLIRLFSARYNNLQGTQYLDEMRNFTVSDYNATPDSNNKVYLDGATSPYIPDYLHALNIRLTYYEDLYLKIIGATNASPIVIAVDRQNTYNKQVGNNLRTSNYSSLTPEKIVIGGVVGNTAANGTFYLMKQGDYKFELFNDAFFRSPVQGNGTFNPYASANATISRVYDFPAKPYLTVEKGGITSNATLRYPNYQIAEGAIKCYPDNQQCKGMTIDYMKDSAPYPDCTNDTFDYETLFPIKFIDDWIGEASLMFSEEMRDSGLEQSSIVDLRQNP